MKEQERLKALVDEQTHNPFAGTFKVSDANFNFLLRKAKEHETLKQAYRDLKGVNHDLESQLDLIKNAIVSSEDKAILLRYYDIQDILGVETSFG